MAPRSRFAVLFGVVALVVAGSVRASAQSATLAWDANTEPSVAGYKVHYGTASREYTRVIDVGNVTTYQVTGLDQSLNYFFAVQAYTSTGLSSALSTEVELPAPVPPGTTVMNSLRANAAYPLLIEKPVTWTASATSKLGPVQYQFWLFGRTGWTMVQDFSGSNTFTWTPSWDDQGLHYLQVRARTVGSTAVYEAYRSIGPFYVNSLPFTLSSDVDFPTPPENPVTWTATVAGAGPVTLEYKFWVFSQSNGWTIFKDWSASNQAVWTPPAVGDYVVQAWVRRVGGSANYDLYVSSGFFRVSRTRASITSLRSNTSFPADTGTDITWTARARGGEAGPLEYQFWLFSDSGWTVAQPYSTAKTFTWTPTWGDDGTHVVQVRVRSAGASADYEGFRSSDFFTIRQAALQLHSSSLFPAAPGTTVTWSADVADPTANIEYQFWLYTQSTGTWAIVKPYGSTKTWTWTPAPGVYAVQAWARVIGSTEPYQAWRGSNFITVGASPAKIHSLTPSVSLPATAGSTITWTAVASGGDAGPVQYQFWLFDPITGWSIVRPWSTSNTFTWETSGADSGQHIVQVWVRSAGSTALYEAYLSSGFFRLQ